MIICGYPGIGKTYLAKNFSNVMDLESTPFNNDFDCYFRCAKHYSDQGFLVLVSCHKEIREKVLKLRFDERLTIFPCPQDKDLYKRRYKERGNTQEFIGAQMENWDKWVSKESHLLGEHVEYLESGETLYKAIHRLAKDSPNRYCTFDACPMPYACFKMCKNPLKKYVENSFNRHL